MRKRVLMGFLVCTVMCAGMLMGCGGSESDAKQTSAKKQVKEDYNGEEFEYRFREDGTVEILGYNGSSSEVVIPEQILDRNVEVLNENVFANSQEITSVEIPGTVNKIGDGLLDNFGDAEIRGYDYTVAYYYAANNNHKFNSMGENPTPVTKVKLSSKDGEEDYTLLDGKSTPADSDYAGASFALEDGEAVLTLNGYTGGGIYSNQYANLTIRLVNGSTNTITAADYNGIQIIGKLVIEGEGELIVTGGVKGDTLSDDSPVTGMGIMSRGLEIKNGAKVSASAGSVPGWVGMGVCCSDLKIHNASLEASNGGEDMRGVALWVSSESAPVLEGASIEEGGDIVEVTNSSNMEMVGYSIGSDAVLIKSDFTFVNASSKVKIIKK